MGFRFFEKNKINCILAAGCGLALMIFPEVAVNASKEGMRIWMNAVVPSLLPFMIIVAYVKRFEVENISASRFYPVFMAFLSGYPMGAKVAGELYQEGRIDEKGLHQILYYAMITGPAFLIGGIGVSFYGSKMAGYLLAFSHYAGALTCGLLLGKDSKGEMSPVSKTHFPGRYKTETPFADCILESFKNLGIVLGYIVIFMICADFIEFAGFLESLPDGAGPFCKGILEMTVGCSEIAACGCSLERKLVLSSFIVSFGGLSVIGQTMSMLEDCPVTLLQILKMKGFHGIFSAIYTFTLCAFVV